MAHLVVLHRNSLRCSWSSPASWLAVCMWVTTCLTVVRLLPADNGEVAADQLTPTNIDLYRLNDVLVLFTMTIFTCIPYVLFGFTAHIPV